MKVLFIGDIIGSLGRKAVKEILPELKKEVSADLIIANGENSAHGYGITHKIYNELIEMGIDAITMGNHIWDKAEFAQIIDKCPKIIRPANYPKGTPGADYLVLKYKDTKIALVNLSGRVFMQCIDCPFQAADRLIEKLKNECQAIIVDFHGEATSEKCAMGWYLDGLAAAVLGTHTHVQTADERLLPKGTAFISDIGMVGSLNSIIGMTPENILKRFTTQMPHHFEPVEDGPVLFNSVLLTIDPASGKCTEIKRVNKIIEGISIKKKAKPGPA